MNCWGACNAAQQFIHTFIDRRFYVGVLVNPISLVWVFSFCLTLRCQWAVLAPPAHLVQEPRCLAGAVRERSKIFRLVLKGAVPMFYPPVFESKPSIFMLAWL